MCQFIESICCLDGEPKLLHHHQTRLERTFSKFYPEHQPLEISEIIEHVPSSGKFKCRLQYDAKSFSLAYQPYQNPVINSLQIVHNDHIDYEFKSTNRVQLDKVFAQREEADDIIIINNGLVTDSHYANLAFFDGSEWWTPQRPLLKGVKRASLLEKKLINTKEIKVRDLRFFTKVSPINAMLDLGEIEISINNIIP